MRESNVTGIEHMEARVRRNNTNTRKGTKSTDTQRNIELATENGSRVIIETERRQFTRRTPHHKSGKTKCREKLDKAVNNETRKKR